MVSKVALENALTKALDQGGDFAEIFLEDTVTNGVSLVDGTVDSATTARRHGAGLRLYNGLNSIYVHSTDTSPEGLLRLAEQAGSAIGRSGQASISLTEKSYPNIHPIRFAPSVVAGERRAKLLHEADVAARSASPEINQVNASLRDIETMVTIANSEGLLISDKRIYTRLGIDAIASSGTETQRGYERPGAMMGYELFEKQVDVSLAAKEAARMAVTMLHADYCPACVMPVVIGDGFGGVIFHEACGHSLEATAVAFGNSEFSGKLGQRIAADCVSAIDDGTIPNEWGSIHIDDEGTPTTKLQLIENGILKNYMVDRLNGRRMNMPITGNARRQDYTFAPTSRMRNTYIAPGESDEEEIIRTMGDGLYAKAMGGGSVNPVTGEFNFGVAEGYMIKDGKIGRPVRGAMLIGRGGEVLLKIDRIGKKMRMAQGMCGSSSGMVPTNVGQPMIRVSSLTVGGR